MKKILISFLLITLASFVWGVEYAGNPGANHSILIAFENTRYKDQLVEELVSKLDNGNVYLTLANHGDGELDEFNSGDFDAVFITNSGAQARVRPIVIRWLDINSRENVILHTTQTTNWMPDVEVDSITSASRRSNIGTLTDDIVRRIRLLF